MPSTSLTVVLVHRNDIERAQIRQALEAVPGVQIAGERTDLRAGMALAHQVRPDILLLEAAGGAEESLSAASQYRLENQDAAIFLAIDVFNPDTLVRAMRAGAQEVLKRPLDRAALTEAVERVALLKARKSGSVQSRSVITVFSSKGGVGVSTIAVNLALATRRLSGRDVALADFDYQSGDAATLLGLAPRRSIGDLVSVERLDSAALQGALCKHPSGLMVLPQPETLDEADGLSAHRVGSILEVLGSTHEIVVVDAPHLVNDIALEIFDRSSTIVLIVEPSLPSVRAARRSLDIFSRLNFLAVPDRVRLLVNRRSDRGAITPAQVEETLGMPISFSVANDYGAVSESINLGRPLCLAEPTGRAGKDIDTIARELVEIPEIQPAEENAPRRKGLRLFGRG
jgi:pilus assembly protein CpaE